jgi:hypothetical protein
MPTLNDTYIEILKSVAQGNACEARDLEYYGVTPTFERDPKIEEISPLKIDTKVNSILKNYYFKFKDRLVNGDLIRHKGLACIELISYNPITKTLALMFRRAGVFPALYCDFIAISKLSQELGAQKVDLIFRKVSAKFEAPYFKALLDRFGIIEMSDTSKKHIDYMLKLYYDTVQGKYNMRLERAIRFIVRYFRVVKKKISAKEEKALYNYLKFKAGLSKSAEGAESIVTEEFIRRLVSEEVTLRDIYLQLIRDLALSPKLEIKDVKIDNVTPIFERIPEIEDLSYLILDRKAKTIFKHYYQPHLEKLKAGEKIHLGRSYCVEEISYDGNLNVTFRKARIFPTLYCDFIVLSMLAKELNVQRINLYFKNVSAQIIAPYFKALIDRLGIREISEGSMNWINYMMKTYRDAAVYLKVPKLGHLLKLIAFYYCTVEKRINRKEARYLYYYFRKCANLKLWSEAKCEDGYKIRLKLLSELTGNTSQ